jgi:hypothetical protein
LWLRQEPQPQILRHVGVLVFVDQDELEALLVLAQHLRVLPEQADALEQQVAEVGGVERLQPLLVGEVELLALAVGEAGGLARGHQVGGEAAVLPAVEDRGEDPRRPALVVDLLGFQQLLDDADLVVGVEDGEVGLEPGELGVAAQDLHPDRVEGAEPGHALDRLADHGADAVLHLARRLVGEGDGEDVAGAGATERQDVGDARGQDAGLAGPRAGQHQHRAVQRLHGLALFRVEVGEIAGRTRPERPCGDAARSRLRRRFDGLEALGFGHVILLPARWHSQAAISRAAAALAAQDARL